MGKIYLSKINNKTQDLVNYFEINRQNSDYIRKLNQIKIHYISQIKSQKHKLAACEKADKFIDVIEHILDNYKMDIRYWECIKDEFDSGSAYVRNRMREYVGTDETETYYQTHAANYSAFLARLEDILADTENHYKERFIKLSCDFLKQFLKNMKGQGQL